jgi:uncharacterized protein (TIGR00375 family)
MNKMRIFADLHIHSHYSRATSREMNIENLEKFSKLKGLNLIGTGDFTHPYWLEELKSSLREIEGSGLFYFRDSKVFFMLQTEVSNVFEQGGKIRKVHNVILAPSFEVVEQINEFLEKYGNLSSDGRPVLNLSCIELVENLIGISKDTMIIPAHAWTPWYGILGSKSGFDSIEECFQDQTKNIFAIETGLSSDPPMNWRLSSLDKFTLISNSDSHSPWPHRLGREANVFELEKITYWEIIDTIKEKDRKRILFTIEVDPSYGKYHWDGHRNCNVSLEPKDAMKYNNICPVCGRKLTIGVLHRVEELADRPDGFIPKGVIPFKRLIPLSELVAIVYNTQPFSKKVWSETMKLIEKFGSELNVLLEVPENSLRSITNERIADLIMKNREGKLVIQPGYDGVYGKIILEGGVKTKQPQKRIDAYINK